MGKQMSILRTVVKEVVPPFLMRGLRCLFVGGVRHNPPDAEFYAPLFSPWLMPEFRALMERVTPLTLVSPERCWMLWSLAQHCRQIPGNFMEAGVYKGGTAILLRAAIERAGAPGDKKLRLFDTFAGMPETDAARDYHKRGDFMDTDLVRVQGNVGTVDFIEYREGFIPDTFAGLEDEQFAFVHVDLDIYRSITDCCAFVYPRMTAGAVMVFDDYGFPGCPGARAAVDEFFADKPEHPLVLPTGQAVVIRHTE